MKYEPHEVELRWQQRWQAEGVFRAEPDAARQKFYVLEMLPYPSGKLHMGHVRNYSIGDAIAWFERLRGKNVFHAIGWDAMGLPAENAAIRNGVPPADWTNRNIAQMREQLQRFGFSYDWRREIASCHPGYYRWNQWFFLKMLEHDLAYRARRSLNWCPNCSTVLANEQVTSAGCCWRHEETPVKKVELDQWFLRTTRYADRLLEGLAALADGWPDRVVSMQRHWIGRSEGCRFGFELADPPEGAPATIEVFSTRVDTVFGCSAVLVAPDHPAVEALARGSKNEEALRRFIDEHAGAATAPNEEREKVGVFSGHHALNPFSGDRVPVWLANFVLAEFGTGAVFAQPAHDQRDYEFAVKYGLAIRPVVSTDGKRLTGQQLDEAQTEEGLLFDSGPFDGMTSKQARRRMTEHAQEMGFGSAEIQYRLKDWGISRQRYWGTPIPIVYCEDCGIVPVPEKDLPVLLPEIAEWKGTTGSPLASAEEFVNTPCPGCGKSARRETDTMDTFVDSSWYFLRYMDPRNEEAPFDSRIAEHWMPIDIYVGGVEHAVGHLIYARFWTMVLNDMGLIQVSEPATGLFTQGMVNSASYRCPVHDFIEPEQARKSGSEFVCPECDRALAVRVEKMSKSKLNSESPDELIERFGSDAMRLFSLFGGPPVKDLEWSQQGIEGTHRFVQRIARLCDRMRPLTAGPAASESSLAAIPRGSAAFELRRKTHWAIDKVTTDMERGLQLNTAISALMELVNELYHHTEGQEVEPGTDQALAVVEALSTLALLLAPFAPHLAEEMNAWAGRRELVARSRWPVAEPGLLIEQEVSLPVQVNGRLRGQIRVPRGATEDRILEMVRELEGLNRHLEGKTIARVIHVPDRMVNLVLK